MDAMGWVYCNLCINCAFGRKSKKRLTNREKERKEEERISDLSNSKSLKKIQNQWPVFVSSSFTYHCVPHV